MRKLPLMLGVAASLFCLVLPFYSTAVVNDWKMEWDALDGSAGSLRPSTVSAKEWASARCTNAYTRRPRASVLDCVAVHHGATSDWMASSG